MKIARDVPSIYAAAMRKWGKDGQLNVLQEECVELIVAISHVKRARPEAMKGFVEELADVNIMVGQFIQYLEGSRYGAEFWQVTHEKLDRLHERLARQE
ncbi:MAG: hypothetical protein HDQ91_01955 [Desulfovibrio sp.]|nr:hypothetical protein [Desulfovibrio sp.]